MSEQRDGGHHGEHGLAARVERLEALEAVRDLGGEYARRTERMVANTNHETAAALAALFTEDAVANYGPFGTVHGRDAITALFENVMGPPFSWSMHYITNHLFTVDGDTAEGSVYFLVFSQPAAPPGAPLATLYGLYHLKLRKVGSAWQIANLVASLTSPPGGG